MSLLWARVTTLIVLLGVVTGLWLLADRIGAWIILPIVGWTLLDTYCQRKHNGFSWDVLCRALQREPED